jgi:hypothetical protein
VTRVAAFAPRKPAAPAISKRDIFERSERVYLDLAGKCERLAELARTAD